ncbi:D-alanyl-D-alanine carboxypeptidase [Fulvivirga sedimenti]|uniref:D-alanyl-D-alanine carboxypeptidase n=1 Tax=Fulvivirga sedimenti TaxID=2879465 RepID=A0A9X1HWB4_9BACT|nr:D-alanyl-D-alanine carboxypeptidase [Fulvivirga sedimenti]MCA6078580.1 D-alanyl-D-alanine carboxypeptidase [Fulvivirga sedimenti]
MKNLLLFGAIVFFHFSCSSIRKGPIEKDLKALQNKFQNHTGFALYDPETDKMIMSYNGDRYFTPASNTKIFTLYTSLNTLGDSLPGIQYTTHQDSLFFWATGDPSLYYDDLPASHVIEFLSGRTETLVYAEERVRIERFGPGWSWDDYNYAYSVERTPFPIYGNRFTFSLDSVSGLLDSPQEFFKRYIWLGDTLDQPEMVRDYESNRTTFFPGRNRSNEVFSIPFKYSTELVARLLTDTLKRKVNPMQLERPSKNELKTIYSIPTDSALTIMMQNSDNFIAEQLMAMNGLLLTDTLDAETGIRAAEKLYFAGMPDKPQWVDGSGLSRFNLFTPRSIVWLWKQLYTQFGKDRLFPMIASGGGNGTLKYYYQTDPPFIFGKTGTLSNNNSLSGFLITKKGKLLIFSMLHNNYPGYSTPVKREMERILTAIHDNY